MFRIGVISSSSSDIIIFLIDTALMMNITVNPKQNFQKIKIIKLIPDNSYVLYWKNFKSNLSMHGKSVDRINSFKQSDNGRKVVVCLASAAFSTFYFLLI